MKIKQQGFALHGVLIGVAVVALIAGAGYVVYSRQTKNDGSVQNASTSVTKKIAEQSTKTFAVDGTAKTAVTEISSQVTSEIKLDDDGFNEEDVDAQSDDSDTVINNVEGSINEKNF